MNRISKPPEIRRREILEVAQKTFMEKGYDKTSMADIADKLQVTQGLCYRYFKSKQELFNIAMDDYANECSKKFIEVIQDTNIDYIEKIKKLAELMIKFENPNGINAYYHKAGNEIIHEQLELKILMTIKEPVSEFIQELVREGVVSNINNIEVINSFITYGIFGVLKCEDINIEEKINYICEYLSNILGLDFKKIISL